MISGALEYLVKKTETSTLWFDYRFGWVGVRLGLGWGWVGVKICVLPNDRWLGGWLDPDENNASQALTRRFFPQTECGNYNT